MCQQWRFGTPFTKEEHFVFGSHRKRLINSIILFQRNYVTGPAVKHIHDEDYYCVQQVGVPLDKRKMKWIWL